MADNFFEEQTEDTGVADVEKIKLGDEEYTQDELAHLVGLGKIGQEAEEKYKTKIDRIWPEYTKSRQQISEQDKRIQEYEDKLNAGQDRQQSLGGQLSPEEIKRQALEQARALGLADVEIVRQTIREELAASELIQSAQGVLSEAAQDGNPAASIDELLQHMQETGISNPKKAYKDMFEDELDKIKEQKYQTLRQPGMVTTNQSTAGAKQPSPVRVTRDNLKQLVGEELNKGSS